MFIIKPCDSMYNNCKVSIKSINKSFAAGRLGGGARACVSAAWQLPEEEFVSSLRKIYIASDEV